MPTFNQFFSDLKLLKAPIARAAYSDRTSWIMSQCAELAYLEDEKKLRAGLAEGDFKLIQCFKGTEQNAGYLAVSAKHGFAVLAFKGTVPSEWGTVKTDLNFWFYKKGPGEFHDGFYTAFKSMENEIMRALKKMRVPIYLCGHSLGGAIAIMAAINLPNTDRFGACYTFGSPRICDLKEVIYFYKVPVYRVVHSNDVVPALPPFCFGYSQIGDIRFINDLNEIIPGSAAVFIRIGVQLRAVFTLAFKTLISDHAIASYSEILMKIAESRSEEVLKPKIEYLRFKK